MPPRRHLPGRLPRRAARTVADTPPCVGFRCGYAAIIGRPNVGKSTLLNRLVGQKVSITSRKAQTTRHRVTGIVTMPDAQVVFVDTPGFQTKHRSRLNERMNRAVTQCLADVDATVLVLEAGRTTDADRAVIRLLPEGATVVVALNKIDRQKDRDALLPQMAELAALFPFSAIVPVSAEKERALDVLLGEVRALLPEGAPIFGADEITDRDERFLAAEFVREKIFRLLGEEVPYATTVTVDRFEHEGALRRIHATIYVDRESQRAILLGAGGERMKEIASTARVDMERLFGGKVFLEVWVRVKGGWADDEALLTRLGY
jgi:GTPase